MNKLVVRLKDQKVKTVQELQRLEFRIIAVGGSFTDAAMLGAAEKGILWLAYSPCLFIPTSLISSFALDLNFLAAFFFVDLLVVLVRFLFDQRASNGCGKVAAG